MHYFPTDKINASIRIRRQKSEFAFDECEFWPASSHAKQRTLFTNVELTVWFYGVYRRLAAYLGHLFMYFDSVLFSKAQIPLGPVSP